MKLGALRAAIRAEKAVSVEAHGMLVLVQKGSLLEALVEQFPDGKAQETGLCLVDGRLREKVKRTDYSVWGEAEDVARGQQIDLEECIAARANADALRVNPPADDLDDLL